MGRRITYNAVMDASQKFREDMEKEYPNDTFDSSDLETAFREGILWFKDKLWHKPEEIPEENTTILFEFYLPNITVPCFTEMNIIFEDDYKELALGNYKILRWCYINDLI